MRRNQFGFSLIELLVVISIIGVLSAVLYANFSQGSAQSRDAQRQSDLRTMESALELYKNKYGRYPEGCNAVGSWSGQTGTAYACLSGNQYIVGLAPEFLPTLPTDPKLNGANSGYVYTTNTEGSVYIIKARTTVESETVGYEHPFKSCPSNNATGVNGDICDAMATTNNGGNRPAWCRTTSTLFQTSYGVWGGWADEPFGYVHLGQPGGHARAQELTERVACMIE